MEQKLNIRNTLAKFVLDQTVAALVNVITFLGGVKLLNGESTGVSWQIVKEVRYTPLGRTPHHDTLSDRKQHCRECGDMCKLID